MLQECLYMSVLYCVLKKQQHQRNNIHPSMATGMGKQWLRVWANICTNIRASTGEAIPCCGAACLPGAPTDLANSNADILGLLAQMSANCFRFIRI